MKELNGGATPKYNSYRMHSTVGGGCAAIGEVAFIGYELIDDTGDDISCPITVTFNDGDGTTEQVASLPGGVNAKEVIYKVDKTPVIESVSNRNLDVEGNENLVITGRNLAGSGTEVVIDGVPCTIVGVPTDTKITCTTGPRIDDGSG